MARPLDEVLADVVALVAGLQVPVSITGPKVALGTGHEAWTRLRDDMTESSIGWMGTDLEPYVEKLRDALLVAQNDGPLRILLESAACRALPDSQMSTHDSVAAEVLDALRTAGYGLVKL